MGSFLAHSSLTKPFKMDGLPHTHTTELVTDSKNAAGLRRRPKVTEGLTGSEVVFDFEG